MVTLGTRNLTALLTYTSGFLYDFMTVVSGLIITGLIAVKMPELTRQLYE